MYGIERFSRYFAQFKKKKKEKRKPEQEQRWVNIYFFHFHVFAYPKTRNREERGWKQDSCMSNTLRDVDF